MLNKKKRIALAAAGTLVMLTMTGCSAADVLGITQAQAALDAVAEEQKPSAEPTAEETAESATDATSEETAPEPTPAAQATENALVALQAPTGDLASGSVAHTIPAGSGTVHLNYWTNQNPAEWTNDLSVPVYLNVTIGDAGPKARYTINAFSAKTTEAQLVSDIGNYEITPPFSYFTTIVVGPTASDSLELIVEMEISMETAEGTGDYTKVRVADKLTIDFASAPVETTPKEAETRTASTH
ncbi:hypothetical protein [Desertivibrio insolitus]|uniref:hypothetical protein n=1 Tax=Herbiconiux sp. SYSU D00978 TaxID=2812562 RepID=UPI001A96F382|nr:hypothetical protein [Herbiconiux sp. SYSU D00978]